MTRHTWQCFSSKAVCQPNFSYNMNHGIRTWGSSLSVWIKSYNQNNRISAVMKTKIPTTNYNHATNFFTIFYISCDFPHWETSYWLCSAKVLLLLGKTDYSSVCVRQYLSLPEVQPLLISQGNLLVISSSKK